jgi:pimeloyl-ACP methyl ester carboxylesterase
MYEEREVILGGIKQVIALEGLDEGPIMIMLHGGPLTPVIYGHAYRGYYPVLYKNVGLVWWDQYGCGRNHARNIDENIKVEDYAKMTVDLVDAVHTMFPGRKIILNGNSFGSYLALYAADKRPDIVSGLICLGPICNMKEALANFENAAKNHYTAKEKAKVEGLRGRSSIEQYMYIGDKLAEKYTNCAHYKGREAHDGLTMKWVKRLITSKDWKLSDFMATLKMISTPGKAYDALWNSLFEIDLTNIYCNLGIPTLLLQGSEELFVLPEKLQKFAVMNDNIKYIKFDYCGHIPTTESFPKMLNKMVEFTGKIKSEKENGDEI